MTTAFGVPAATRHVYFHDPEAPVASIVTPSVFVAVRWHEGRLLLVRRRDSGAWELPGGRVDVGEAAVDAAVRETAEEAGIQVVVTGLLGLFTDPGHVIRSPGGEVSQQFAVLFRARAVGGRSAGGPTDDERGRLGRRRGAAPSARSRPRCGHGSPRRWPTTMPP